MVDEQSVAASLGLIENVENRGSGRLIFVSDIGMSGHRASIGGKEGVKRGVSCSAVD